MASASMRLSFAFSSASALSRRASDTLRPPNFAFQAEMSRLADPVAAADVGRRRARLLLAQDRDDLLL